MFSAFKVPIFNKREEIFDVLFEKNVPVFRAVWYIKVRLFCRRISVHMHMYIHVCVRPRALLVYRTM